MCVHTQTQTQTHSYDPNIKESSLNWICLTHQESYHIVLIFSSCRSVAKISCGPTFGTLSLLLEICPLPGKGNCTASFSLFLSGSPSSRIQWPTEKLLHPSYPWLRSGSPFTLWACMLGNVGLGAGFPPFLPIFLSGCDGFSAVTDYTGRSPLPQKRSLHPSDFW